MSKQDDDTKKMNINRHKKGSEKQKMKQEWLKNEQKIVENNNVMAMASDIYAGEGG